MNRHAIKRLEHWKDAKGRKPMIIRGARQVGKTWLMKEFGRTRFAKTAYVNFENNDRAKAIFEMDFDLTYGRQIPAMKERSRLRGGIISDGTDKANF